MLGIGRSVIQTQLVRSERSTGELEIECWHTPTAADPHAQVRELRNDLQGQIGDLVACTWDGPAVLSGFYILRAADIETVGHRFTCNLALDYVGSANDLVFESRVVGKVKINDFNFTDASSEPILVPPPHRNYSPRHASTVSRLVEGSPDLVVYRDIDFAIDPRYSVQPEDYYLGAAEVGRRGGEPIGGRNLFVDSFEDIELRNGIARCWLAADGVAWIGRWDGQWRDKPVVLVDEGVGQTDWDHVAILSNRPERCVLRYSGGSKQLDVSLRRGDAGVSILLTSDVAATKGIYDYALTDMTITSNRAVYSAADSNGHSLLFASTRTFSSAPLDGNIWKATTKRFDAFVALVLGGAVAGNTAVGLTAQYMAAVAENVRALGR
jgi:hypothetical protein